MIQHIYHACCTQHVLVLYINAWTPTGKYYNIVYIGLNILEPLDLLLVGKSVQRTLLDLKKKIIAI
jgi:hypothetical protein